MLYIFCVKILSTMAPYRKTLDVKKKKTATAIIKYFQKEKLSYQFLIDLLSKVVNSEGR